MRPDGLIGRAQQLSLKLFPGFEDPQWPVQRLVGVVGGGGTILIGIVNSFNYGYASGVGFVATLFSAYTGLILVLGIINIACGFWDHPVARWVHIGLFVFAGIFGAISANRGNITSAFFLVFAVVLLVEYGVGRRIAWVFTFTMLAGYVAALSIGYLDDVVHPVASAFASLVTVLVFVGLFGGVTLRHRLLLRRDALELEQRIELRTAELHNALAERMVMLREIHHRVKNNLQTVSTLLGMEIDRTPDPDARRALVSSQRRIHAMARVHDALHQSDRLDRVDLSKYVRDLVDTIIQTAAEPIDLDLSVSSSRPVDLSLAVSLGLALNELVTNSLNHAYSRGAERRLLVEVELTDAHVSVRVGDNGSGLPEGFDPASHGRVGLSVVTSIVTHRGGTVEFDGRDGTTCRLIVPVRSDWD